MTENTTLREGRRGRELAARESVLNFGARIDATELVRRQNDRERHVKRKRAVLNFEGPKTIRWHGLVDRMTESATLKERVFPVRGSDLNFKGPETNRYDGTSSSTE